MTREEAIRQIENRWSIMDYGESEALGEALDMAIEALSADALLKQEIDFYKKISRIEAEKVVDLEHKLADMVSVVRCKDCRWWSCKDSLHQHNSHLCRYWKSTNTSADDFCSYGER